MTKNIKFKWCCFSVTQYWLTLQSHGLQHARLPCPSVSPRVCSHSCPLSLWYYLTISSPASPFSFCLQSFPASKSFPLSQLFTLGGQSIIINISFSISPSNENSRLISFWINWLDLLAVQRTLKSLLHNSKASVFWPSAFFMVQWRLQNNSWTKEKQSMFFNRKIKI